MASLSRPVRSADPGGSLRRPLAPPIRPAGAVGDARPDRRGQPVPHAALLPKVWTPAVRAAGASRRGLAAQRPLPLQRPDERPRLRVVAGVVVGQLRDPHPVDLRHTACRGLVAVSPSGLAPPLFQPADAPVAGLGERRVHHGALPWLAAGLSAGRGHAVAALDRHPRRRAVNTGTPSLSHTSTSNSFMCGTPSTVLVPSALNLLHDLGSSRLTAIR